MSQIERATPVPALPGPHLGLVCLTAGADVRFRTITRTRFLSLSAPARERVLRELYTDNLQRLFGALAFCRAHRIRLYRAPSGLFPMNDYAAGERALEELAPRMSGFGDTAERFGVRVVMHPDQFVVLNSARPAVVRQSLGILEHHALVFDRLGLPRMPWAALTLHGGKRGRADELVAVIAGLSPGARGRLVLENDEAAYSAAEILEICRRARVPMVFDPHHHVIRERLSSYADPTVAHCVGAARGTWPKPEWQLTHLSNGAASFGDPRHSELIRELPAALLTAPWIEVEAKGKENAIADLRRRWPQLE